jgi:hypothetical protein
MKPKTLIFMLLMLCMGIAHAAQSHASFSISVMVVDACDTHVSNSGKIVAQCSGKNTAAQQVITVTPPTPEQLAMYGVSYTSQNVKVVTITY